MSGGGSLRFSQERPARDVAQSEEVDRGRRTRRRGMSLSVRPRNGTVGQRTTNTRPIS